MASTLVVEDGSIVASCDSYITLADARVYAAKRGITIEADDTKADVQLRKAFDYLEAKDYKGKKVDASTQHGQWPRKCVWVDGVELLSSVIPDALQSAQVQLAAAINSGLDINPTRDNSSFVTRETVGPITTQYSEYIGTSGVPIVRVADDLLAPLLNEGSGLLTVTRA